MHWPQIVFISLYVAAFCLAAVNHGKPRGNYNILETTLAIILGVSVLYFGGFWSN